MVDIVGLYQSLLLEASYAGVPFNMVDSREEIGRRVLRFLFPAVDAPAFQDLGEAIAEIEVTGLLVGDDYIEQAALMRAALLKPGPAMLVHPWLGHVQVMLPPDRGPAFSFRQDELRVARFQVTFLRFRPPPPVALDTLGLLETALDSLRAQADALLAAVLAPAALTVAAIGAVESFAGGMVSLWSNAVGAIAGIPATITGAVLGLTGVIGAPIDSTYPATVGTTLGAPSVAIAAAAAPVLPPAVAPNGATALPVALDARTATTAILAAVTAMGTLAADPTITLAAQALALADAVTTAENIPFDSQQEAMQWGAQLRAALSAAATSAASVSQLHPVPGGALWRAIIAAQSALAADLNARIGRLPSVVAFTLARPAPVWLIAQALAGDTPSLVVPTYLDIVQRNTIAHPGAVAAGTLEILRT